MFPGFWDLLCNFVSVNSFDAVFIFSKMIPWYFPNFCFLAYTSNFGLQLWVFLLLHSFKWKWQWSRSVVSDSLRPMLEWVAISFSSSFFILLSTSQLLIQCFWHCYAFISFNIFSNISIAPMGRQTFYYIFSPLSWNFKWYRHLNQSYFQRDK